MHTFQKTALVLALSAALVACGGGGGSTAATGSSTSVSTVTANAGSLTGTVATGSAVKDAKVEIKDAKGVVVQTTTDANGVYTIDTSKLTAPFLIKASGGTLVSTGKANLSELYSFSLSGEKTAQVTPLTQLLLSQLANTLPADAFNKNEAGLQTKLLDKAAVDAAMNALATYLSTNLGLDIKVLGNTITVKLDPMASNDVYDTLLEKLTEKDPNFANKSVELVKSNGGSVAIDPAKETLGQCVASLALPADLQSVANAGPDVTFYTWDGHKKVDWTGQKQYKEGWLGGYSKLNDPSAATSVQLNGETVLRNINELVVQEDDTVPNPNAYPYTVKQNTYRTADRKKSLGWRGEYFDRNNVATGEWQQKINTSSAPSNEQAFGLVVSTPVKDGYTRKAEASWQADGARTESLQGEVTFIGREKIQTRFGLIDTCVTQEKTNIQQKKANGDVSVNVVWTAKTWYMAKLGYAKYQTTDTESDVSGSLLSDETRTYDIVGTRKNGVRYGNHDLWFGTLTSQTGTTNKPGSVCDKTSETGTLGYNWVVKSNATAKTAVISLWDGAKMTDSTLNYPGATTLSSFRKEVWGSTTINWAQAVNFDLAANSLTGTYTRTTTDSVAACTGSNPSKIVASKLF